MSSLFDRLFDALLGRKSGAADPACNLQALRSHPRRLLYVGGVVVSVLLLGSVIWAMTMQAGNYRGERLRDFERGRLALQAYLAANAASQARLINMTRFVWERRLESDPEPVAANLAAYQKNGQRLVVRYDEQSAAQTILGLGVEGWPEQTLRRYIALARLISLISRLTFSGEKSDSAADSFFISPSGQFVVLNHGLDEAALMKGLGVDDREGLFNRLRAYAYLNPSAAHPDPVRPPRGRAAHKVPRLSVAAHPVTGKPTIVSNFPVRSGGQLIGTYVSFETTRKLAAALHRDMPGSLLVLAPDGQVILGPRSAGGAALVGSLHDAGVWAHAHGELTRYQHGARSFIAALVPGTDWSLVTSYSWSESFLADRRLLALALAVWMVLMAALWLLVVWIDRRVFAPAVARAGQIYASEQLSRSLIEMTPVGLCLVDIENSVAVLQNELVVRHARDFLANDRNLYAALVQNYQASACSGLPGESREFELAHGSACGQSTRHLLVGACQATYEGRQVLLCALQDVTLRVELQEQQARLREQAEAASEAKSRFLAIMSHEIRTPLHGILGHLELLSRSELDPEQMTRLHRITQSADSLLLIINDVLDVSRIESGQLDIDATTFEPVELLERVALLYAPLAQAKGVDLDFTVEPGLGQRYRGAVARMEQVLRNLVSNAVKFTASGRIEIRVLAGVAADQLRFEVADSGIGLTPLQQQRLFQPFVQADESIGGRFGGSGLGLSLCRQLCQLMGGEIEVRSTPGVGSVFAFSVRVQACNGQEGARPLAARRILVLSAVVTWREELARRLRNWGAEVTVGEAMADAASYGWDAVVLFERNLPVAPGASREHGAPLVRVRADGPLSAVLRDGHWWVSCYAGQGLLHLLQEQLGEAPRRSAVDDELPLLMAEAENIG